VSSYGHETAARNPQGEVLWHWGLGVRKYISLPTDLVRQNTGHTLGKTYRGWIWQSQSGRSFAGQRFRRCL